jgi:DNA polymerase III alpha subunit
MTFDQHGQLVINSNELANELYRCPDLDISNFSVTDSDQFNSSVKELHTDFGLLNQYLSLDDLSVDKFDELMQSQWHMPDEYKNLDIATHVLNLCQTQEELQRVGQELLLYHERNLFDLLKYLKYFVDTMRANNVLWGLGRGSSVASYVLYLLGVHKINSIYYDLSIEEFLK